MHNAPQFAFGAPEVEVNNWLQPMALVSPRFVRFQLQVAF
jgi:hypothetical protein